MPHYKATITPTGFLLFPAAPPRRPIPGNGDLRAWLTARDIKFEGRQRISFELDHKEKEAFREQFKIRLP
jgi:hypothetical protein